LCSKEVGSVVVLLHAVAAAVAVATETSEGKIWLQELQRGGTGLII